MGKFTTFVCGSISLAGQVIRFDRRNLVADQPLIN